MSSKTCTVCNLPLTDPISIEVGMGPVCRVKIKQISSNEKSEDMFNSQSNYEYKFKGKVLAITDLGGDFKSVTNNIEAVLQEIIDEESLEISEYKVMYCDTQGIWDGVKVYSTVSNQVKMVTFFSIHEKEFEPAYTKLINKRD